MSSVKLAQLKTSVGLLMGKKTKPNTKAMIFRTPADRCDFQKSDGCNVIGKMHK